MAEDSVQEWFSAAELAGLPGVPGTERGLRKAAQREHWKQRRKQRGKGCEYAFESLPAETKTALLLRVDIAPPAPALTSTDSAPRKSHGAPRQYAAAELAARWEHFDSLSDTRKAAGYEKARALGAALKLDDDTYRALLERVAGKRSASELDTRALCRVLDELARLRGETRKAYAQGLPNAPKNVREDVALMVAKIEAMLAEAGLSWAYASGIAKRMFGVQKIEWLRAEQIHKLVAALAYDQKRRRAKK